MGRKKVTLKHIAEITGYSITTVSHVINKTRHVEKTTRDRILEAIGKLQYVVPEEKERVGGESEKRMIGVVIADIREDFFAEIVKAIEYSCVENNYALILCDSEDDEEKERYYLKSLIERKVQGLVLFPINSHKSLMNIIPRTIPVVIIDRKLDEKNVSFIGINNFESAYEATKYLLSHGASRIGFICYDEKIYTSRERARGYTTAMNETGAGKQIDILRIDYHNENSTDKIGAFIVDPVNPKDGLICATSNICFDAVSAVSELKLNIPQDIKIVSYDDNKWFDFLTYPISAIRQPTTEMGIVAVEELVSCIEQSRNSNIGKDIFLDYELIDRLS